MPSMMPSHGAAEGQGGGTEGACSSTEPQGASCCTTPPNREAEDDDMDRNDDEEDEDEDTLLKLLARRKLKLAHTTPRRMDDYDDYDDDDVVRHGSSGGSGSPPPSAAIYEYHCQWKHHTPTWEPRWTVENMGYASMVSSFDATLLPSNQGHRVEGRGEIAQARPLAHESPRKLPVEQGQLMRSLGGLQPMLGWVHRQFAGARSVIRYAETRCTDLERRFYRFWQKIDMHYRPEFCFVPMETNRLHNILVRGIDESAAAILATFSGEETGAHSQVVWCCERPECGMTLVGNDLVLVCAALTSRSFLTDESWHAFQRKNGWFPMPKVTAAKKTDQIYLVPMCLVQAKPPASLSDMERLMARHPQSVRPEELIDLAAGDETA